MFNERKTFNMILIRFSW